MLNVASAPGDERLGEILSRKNAILPGVFLAAICAVASIMWFKDANVIYFWDSTVPLDPWAGLVTILHGYRQDFWPGRMDASAVAMAPYFFLLGISSIFPGGFDTAQRIVFAFLFTLPALTCYVAISSIVSSEFQRRNNLYAFVGAIAYTFNPYVMFNLWRIFSTSTFLYAALPLIVLFSYRFLRYGRARQLLAVVLLIEFSGPSLSNIATVCGAVLSVGLLLVLLWSLGVVKTSIARVLLWAGAAAAVGAWAIVPQFLFIHDVSEHLSVAGTWGALQTNTSHNTILDMWRLVGDGTIWENLAGDPDYTWAYLYQSLQPMALLTYVLPLCVLGAVIIGRRSKFVVAFGSAFLIVSYLALGPKMPGLGLLFNWLFGHVTVFQAFRNPFDKIAFGLPMIGAVLIGVGFSYLPDSARTRGLAMLLAAAFLGASWPLVTGAVQRTASLRPSSRVVFPTSWTALKTWAKGHAPILILPSSPWPLVGEQWPSGYIGYDPLRFATYVPVASGTTEYIATDALLKNVNDSLASSSPKLNRQALNAIRALGFKGILMRRDELALVSPNAADAAAIDQHLIGLGIDGIHSFGAIGEGFDVGNSSVSAIGIANVPATPSVTAYSHPGARALLFHQAAKRTRFQVRELKSVACHLWSCSAVLAAGNEGVLIWPRGGHLSDWTLSIQGQREAPAGRADYYAPFWRVASSSKPINVTIDNHAEKNFLFVIAVALTVALAVTLMLLVLCLWKRAPQTRP